MKAIMRVQHKAEPSISVEEIIEADKRYFDENPESDE